MKRITVLALTAILLITLHSGCRKEPGPGGRASIKGKLLSGNIHSPEFEVTEEDGEPDERVYLVYGDREDGFDKDVRTSHDGTFEFKFLRPGTYKIFAYGFDPNMPSSSSRTAVFKTFDITANSQKAEGNNLIVYKEADRGGCSTIKGKVFAQYWNASFSQLRGEGYVGDEDVFVQFGNSGSFHQRIRTSADGTFEIRNLRKGKYRVFLYSKDPAPEFPNGRRTIMQEVEVNGRNSLVDLGDIKINK
jgi:hypothetical protein